MRVSHDPWSWLATVGGVGLAPFAPGTVGSAVACLAFFGLGHLGWLTQLAAILAVTGLGVVSAQRVEAKWDRKDPSAVVIDEVAGQWLTLLALPPTWPVIVAGFVIFRVLDIAKPPPCHWLDRHLPGGWGVMADDLAAGLMGRVLLGAAMTFGFLVP